MSRPRIVRTAGTGIWIVTLVASACGSPSTAPDSITEDPPIPPPGRFFTVSPLPTDLIASISAFGHNNKVLPTNKIYVATCDYGLTERPCNLERLPVRSPGDGLVSHVDPGADGTISIEGPPGLIVHFAHVTAAPGLSAGDSVKAGDVVGTMYYQHSLDFGLTDYSVTQEFVNPQRMHHLYVHSENPLARYAEPVRSELLGLVRTREDPLGSIEYDVAGTASGLWFLEGAPADGESHAIEWWYTHLFLGPLAEYYEIDVVVTGTEWGGFRISGVDPDAPRWEAITPSSGRVQLLLWELGFEYDLRPQPFRGSLLVEMQDSATIQLEWFDTHDVVTEFTEGASIYHR